MATTSIWRVHGSLNKVIKYAANQDKTEMQELSEVPKVEGAELLEQVLNYAGRDDATLNRQLVWGINCGADRAKQDMIAVKKHFRKEGGVIAYHGYQSFAQGECTPEEAHEIGKALATELWGDRYQVLVATHLDKENHLHNHFVINTVSFVDGIKFHRTKEDYREMQKVSDRLCMEHGLSVVKNPNTRGKQYGEWLAEKNGKPTQRGNIRADIDRAIKASYTESDFIRALEQMGYEIKTRTATGNPLKYPGLKPPGAKGFFRFHKLGEDYTLDRVKERIQRNTRRRLPFPEADYETLRQFEPYRIKAKSTSGIYRLYLFYCYELHIIEKYPRHSRVKRVSYQMREDVRKLETIDAKVRLLGENGITTGEQLIAFKENASTELNSLYEKRRELRNQMKKLERAGDEKKIDICKIDTAAVSAKIKMLRKEISLCSSIEEESARVYEDMEQIMEEKEKEEISRDELLKRRSGTGREDVAQRS